MIPKPTQRQRQARRRRNVAFKAFENAEHTYSIAVLDDLTASVLAAFPTATHLKFQHFPDRSAILHGVWGRADAEITCLQSRTDFASDAHPTFDLDEAEAELRECLAPLESVAWMSVRPDFEPGALFTLDLPPENRALAIAEFVRADYDNASALVLDYGYEQPHLVQVLAGTEDGYKVLAASRHNHPLSTLFNAPTVKAIARLARQLRYVPSAPLHDEFKSHGRSLTVLTLPTA
uniref:Uncharacterized protein n=1 Tax=Streptomyces sp. NBC_00003 TaxID=2903608 RepID=A0AAU2V6X9_9ACTN